jgi:hypothetical protein
VYGNATANSGTTYGVYGRRAETQQIPTRQVRRRGQDWPLPSALFHVKIDLAQSMCRLLRHDMRRLTILLSRTGQLDAVLDAARQQPALRTALFDAVSAHAPYRQVVAHSMRPPILAAVVWAGARNLLHMG